MPDVRCSVFVVGCLQVLCVLCDLLLMLFVVACSLLCGGCCLCGVCGLLLFGLWCFMLVG